MTWRLGPRVLRTTACMAAAAAAAGFAAAPASAGTAGVSGGDLIFGAAPGEANQVTITDEGAVYRVVDRGAPTLQALTGCVGEPDPQAVICPAAGIVSLTVSLADDDDRMTASVDVPAGLFGGEGADSIGGGRGPDLILGGPGGDHVQGGPGDDRLLELDVGANDLDGGAGVDQITGGNGPDAVHGGPGDDTQLFGGAGDDLVDGGDGDDVLEAGSGPDGVVGDGDRLVGGPGFDAVTYAGRADAIAASIGDGPDDGVLGEGDDVTADVEALIGGQSGDRLTGGDGADTIDGSGGGDDIDGGAGDDVLSGGTIDAASDTLRGAAGDDALSGEAGGDRLDGGDGGDVLRGGSDADDLLGRAGADTLDGGDGDDLMEGGAGPDPISGGDGEDTVRYADSAEGVQVTIDGVANDGAVTPVRERIRIEEGAVSERDNVDESTERVTGGGEDDTVAGDGAPNTLSGGSGEDVLDGSGGADVISGGGRSDAILARDGVADRVSCGGGYDYVVADRRDLVPGAGSRCEYVDDGTRSRPAARTDVAMAPTCRGSRRDADVSPPRTRRTVPIEERALVPLGSRIDSFDCGVRLQVPVGRGRSRAGRLARGAGAFRVTQRRRPGGRLITRLRTTDCLRRKGTGKPTAYAARARSARYRRRLGRIAFPAEIELVSAVIRPRGIATFTVDDKCGKGAEVRVSSGRLAVVDLGRDRRVVIGRGETVRVEAP